MSSPAAAGAARRRDTIRYSGPASVLRKLPVLHHWVGWRPVRAEKPVQGCDQQSCHPGRLTVMIPGLVPGVRLSPDHAGRGVPAAVTA